MNSNIYDHLVERGPRDNVLKRNTVQQQPRERGNRIAPSTCDAPPSWFYAHGHRAIRVHYDMPTWKRDSTADQHAHPERDDKNAPLPCAIEEIPGEYVDASIIELYGSRSSFTAYLM